MHPQRQGFTLIEMLLVILILGIIGVFGFPRMSAAMANTNVRGARTTLVNLIAKARTAATQTNRIALLKINGDHAFVLLRPRRLPGLGDADTLGTVVRLGDTYGVTVIATIDSVRFDPRGMGTGFGTGTTFLVSRNGHSETITIDGLGRVTK